MRSTRSAVGGTIGSPSPQPRSSHILLIASKSSSASTAAPGAPSSSVSGLIVRSSSRVVFASNVWVPQGHFRARHRDIGHAWLVCTVEVVELELKLIEARVEEHD